jgi:IS30 family transposase
MAAPASAGAIPQALRDHRKRGRLAGKRHISERPAAVELRSEIGHWEMDLAVGAGSNHCIVTLVERVSDATIIGRLRCRKTADVNRRVIEMIEAHRELFITITVDNGLAFHGYKQIEAATGVTIYFANPYASWERARTRTRTDSFANTSRSVHQ